jgi:acid phosphatase type 7
LRTPLRLFAALLLTTGPLWLASESYRSGSALVTRGPYLQRLTTTALIVRWRTDAPTDSRVVFGLEDGALDLTAFDPQLTSEHRVVLSGLTPDTTYFFAIGSSTELLAGGDPGTTFSTAPPAGSGRPIRLWAMGDFGTGSADAIAVRDGFWSWNAGARVDAWLALGDNAYPDGTDAEYTAGLFTPYQEVLRRIPIWPVLGNHDARSADSPTLTGPYYTNFSLPRAGEAGGRPSGTEAWYSFDIGDVHVVVLDSADSNLAPEGPMLSWLVLDLAGSPLPWTVVAFHHPPYTKGSHDSDNPADSEGRMFAMRENVLPILEAAGVDLVLTGHSHGYERSFLLDGHYGTSDTLLPAMIKDRRSGDPATGSAYFKAPGPHGGTVYVVAGSGGHSILPVGHHPALAVRRAEFGSLALEIQGDRARGWFIRADGSVGDRFEIRHQAPIFLDGFESGTTERWSATRSGS